ncbi:MAG: capsule assembly Wzi family protein [Desulfuromonadales bacterium]
MRAAKLCLLITCLLLLTASLCAADNTAYRVSPQLPLQSWAYPALERMVALCQVKTGLAGTRPLTRLEAARLILEASLKAKLYYVPPQAKVLLVRLQSEFRDELAYLTAEPGSPVELPARPLRSAELTYLYQDEQKSLYPGTDARQTSLNYNNSGREYDNYNNLEFSLLGDVTLFDHLLLSWQPLITRRDHGDPRLDALSAVAAFSYEGIELSAGRQSLWWGQGRHGSLILTSNARPLDMLRLSNPSPLQLPWLFKYLGPFRFDLFASRLDDDRVVPEPYFGGLRMNVKPAYWLELGASRTVMFGGDGRPSIDASDFLTIIGGNNLSGNEDTSNSVAGVDVRLSFPLLWGVELYGELVGEDEAGGLFSRNSYLAGAYLPQIEPSGHLSLRIEYADTTRIGGSPVLYRHGIYKSGYIYEGQIMGHHVGSDATDLFVGLDIDCSERLSVSIGFDYEERGKSLAVQEKHAQADLKATWWFNPRLSLAARYAYDRVENWNFASGDEDFQEGSIAVGYTFQ